MSKETREHLSSLMDGELSPEAGRFLTRRLGADSELNATWQRYHLVRDCLRRPGQSLTITQLNVDLDALDGGDEGAASGSGRRPGVPAWLRPLAGSAIAASVAVAAVLVAVNLESPTSAPAAEPFASPNVGPVRREVPLSQPASYQQSMNRYLQRHNQVAGAVGQKGFVSPSPIVLVVPEQVVEMDENSADSASAPPQTDAGRPDQP
jgi:sigma-E factor negative regulatory protein RseA